jgi:GNAT superfamily N-acetyltransferase
MGAPNGHITHWYRFVNQTSEYAFVILDIWPDDDAVILYELVVSPPLRRTGVGTTVLAAVEALTKKMGRCRVRLRPHPLDDSISPSALVRWYMKNGYRAEEGDSDMYYKDL